MDVKFIEKREETCFTCSAYQEGVDSSHQYRTWYPVPGADGTFWCSGCRTVAYLGDTPSPEGGPSLKLED